MHGQRQERHRHERGGVALPRAVRAQLRPGGRHRPRPLEGQLGQQPADRAGHLGHDRAVQHRDLAAADLAQPVDGGGHVGVVHADHTEVVGVVRVRRREGAPRRSPKPDTNPSPIRPVPRCRSMTATFARSRSGSAVGVAVRRARARRPAPRVVRLPGRTPMTRTRPAGRHTRSPRPTAPGCARCPASTPEHDPRRSRPPRRRAATSRPRFHTIVGRKDAQVRDGDDVGDVAGGDRPELGDGGASGRC